MKKLAILFAFMFAVGMMTSALAIPELPHDRCPFGCSEACLHPIDCQQVCVSIPKINVLDVDSGLVCLHLHCMDFIFGGGIVTAKSCYSAVTNLNNQKITAKIDSNMPHDTWLAACLSKIDGASSDGPKFLSTTPATLLHGLSHAGGFGDITYTLGATLKADPMCVKKIVTYTLCDA